MAHAFDSGLLLPQRRLIREALVEQLAELRRASLPGNGAMYLDSVEQLAAPVRFGDEELEEHFLSVLAGRSPVVAIALGDRKFGSHGSDATEWHGELEVHVYCCSRHARSPLARMAGDVVGDVDTTADPGLETVAEHVFERLAGLPVGTSAHSAELRPVSETVAYFGADYTVLEQVYELFVQTDVNPKRRATQVATQVHTTHQEDEAGDPADLVALTELEEP